MSVLVAGVGNVFRGDDGFGCEVLRCILAAPPPPGIVARDFGTSALDLRFWMERHDAVVLVDLVAREARPGTLLVLDPTEHRSGGAAELHGLTATDVVAWAVERGARGRRPRKLRIVGCVPASLGDEEDGALGLSAPVAAAVSEAADRALTLAIELAAEGTSCTSSA